MAARIIGLFLLFISFASGWAWMDYRSAFSEPVVHEHPVIVEIERGDSFNRITQKLIDNRLSIKPFWFKLLAYELDVTHKLKAGEYELAAGVTPPQILMQFAEGKVRQYSITFPEGWTFEQFRREIEKHPKLAHTLDGLSNSDIMDKLDSEIGHPEGMFFPDTYFFENKTPDIDLLQRAYLKMRQVLDDEWADREDNLPLNNEYQALILASIVEKETGAPLERPIIAGVFIRRLKKGMPLQTDPTVIYGIGPEFDGDIRNRDLNRYTPYNTYMIKGLPPTPIAMPGRESIHAVLHPSEDNSLYFVARGDGTHVFSTTLKEHNRAVAIFQLKQKP
ncbi:MAG: endolytic transglycosylase MltG [Gammaproteobacteria bacterium]